MTIIKEPMTATEVDEAIKKWGEKAREAMEPFLAPIFKRCIELMVIHGQISDKQIEEIANEEISKRAFGEDERHEGKENNDVAEMPRQAPFNCS